MLLTSLASLLWLLLPFSNALDSSNVTVTNLTAEHFAELGSRRVKVAYGSHVVPSRDNGMYHFKSPLPPPCNDCMITFMQAHLEYANGSTADAATGMWMHHVVFLNTGKRDSVCPPESVPAQRFFASGNERTAVDLTSTFSASGTQHLGYPFPANASFIMFGELMSMLDTPQEVVFSMVWEFLPSPPSYFKHAIPYWLDVTGCGDSDVQAEADKQFDYSSPPLKADFNADIALIAGHLHDGGTHVDLLLDGEVVCTSEAIYGSADGPLGATDHIAEMTSCLNAGTVKPGEQWYIKASYDTTMHPPMSANDRSLEPVMGIALAYLVKRETTGVSWLSRSTIIFSIVILVMVTGLTGLYVVRQKPEFIRRLSEAGQYREWQRVRDSDPEVDGDDTEDGLLLRQQSK